eukprot:scaffold672409_cov61-Prasinocladus_malaysianus.AAC.1
MGQRAKSVYECGDIPHTDAMGPMNFLAGWTRRDCGQTSRSHWAGGGVGRGEGGRHPRDTNCRRRHVQSALSI